MVRIKPPGREGHLETAGVVGLVNMDQICLDLTDIPWIESPEDAIGTTVEIYSDEVDAPNYLCRVAEIAGRNSYDLLCSLRSSIPRVVVES